MTIRIADRWFERRRVDDDITHLREPHTARVVQCNIWHIRGRERDLLIDTGMGIASLREAAEDLLDKAVIAFATHSHFDHTGSLHEFDVRVAHRAEEQEFAHPPNRWAMRVADWPQEFRDYLAEVGYHIDSEYLVTAFPHPDYDPDSYHTKPAAPTWLVDEGDVIDLGNRAFEVLHLPGHSPGSVGLWEVDTGILFSGDAIYDGPLLDRLPESDIEDYVATMRRLSELPVTVVHAGHDPSFSRARLIEIAEGYIAANG